MNFITLRKVWEAVETIIEKHDQFCATCNDAACNVRCDNIKYSGFCNSRMTRNSTTKDGQMWQAHRGPQLT